MFGPEPAAAFSHNKIEDTREEHLKTRVQAFDRLAGQGAPLDRVGHGHPVLVSSSGAGDSDRLGASAGRGDPGSATIAGLRAPNA
jgi:hypothetical protein